MSTPCSACPLRRLEIFKDFTPDEVAHMERFKTGELTVEPGSPILMEGARSPQLFTALRGLGLRYKTMEDGRRQVVNFVFPGDFIGLQAALLDQMEHSVEATTRMTLCVFNRSEVFNVFRNQPGRAYDMTWLAAQEEHFLGEILTTIGRRSALERIAWAFVRVHQRATHLKLIRSDGIVDLPYRQQDLADALGLSLVHTNKTLAKLRERQLANWVDGRLRINNLEELARVASMVMEPGRPRPLM